MNVGLRSMMLLLRKTCTAPFKRKGFVSCRIPPTLESGGILRDLFELLVRILLRVVLKHAELVDHGVKATVVEFFEHQRRVVEAADVGRGLPERLRGGEVSLPSRFESFSIRSVLFVRCLLTDGRGCKDARSRRLSYVWSVFLPRAPKRQTPRRRPLSALGAS